MTSIWGSREPSIKAVLPQYGPECRIACLMAGEKYTVQQLTAAAGASARTLRHWTRLKLLPKPLGRGRAARYEESHLLRARVIHQLRSAGVSLAHIKQRLAGLSEQEVRALLTPEANAANPGGATSPPPEPNYPFTSWEVVQLATGIVLLVDSQRGPSVRRLASEIYKYFGAPPTSAARAEGHDFGSYAGYDSSSLVRPLHLSRPGSLGSAQGRRRVPARAEAVRGARPPHDGSANPRRERARLSTKPRGRARLARQLESAAARARASAQGLRLERRPCVVPSLTSEHMARGFRRSDFEELLLRLA